MLQLVHHQPEFELDCILVKFLQAVSHSAVLEQRGKAHLHLFRLISWWHMAHNYESQGGRLITLQRAKFCSLLFNPSFFLYTPFGFVSLAPGHHQGCMATNRARWVGRFVRGF